MTQDLTRQQLALANANRFSRGGAAEYVLDAGELVRMNSHLRALGWEPGGPVTSAQRIGDGNMNMTVRIRTARSSCILKQARPWVVKYPHIPAPIERAEVEAAFYAAIAQIAAVANRMPRLLGFDAASHLLWLEDMGEGGDMTDLYRAGGLSSGKCVELTGYLVNLHRACVTESARQQFQNRAMRALNHEHQYDFPLRTDNGLDLDRITPGLAVQAERLKTDEKYCDRVAQLGNAYIADGAALVHGDFFPGSWLRSSRGLAIIDPEFCFVGAAEYDLGVFLAHLELTGARSHWALVKKRYTREIDWTLADAFAGAELMRRLIGVAQLPLAADLKQKSAWLDQSRELLFAL